MNIILWVCQGLLALMFGYAGAIIIVRPKEKLIQRFPWVNDFSPFLVKMNGYSKLAGAAGLIFPMLYGIASKLTPIAAVGLCIIMVLASIYNLRKNNTKETVVNAIIFAITAFIAYGRF